MRTSTLFLFVFTLVISAVLSAPIPTSNIGRASERELDDPHTLFGRQAPPKFTPLSGAPKVGDIVGLAPAATNGQLQTAAPGKKPGFGASVAHPTVVIDGPDDSGSVTVGLVSHNSKLSTPNIDVTQLVDPSELPNVKIIQKDGSVAPLEGFVFTGSPVKVPVSSLQTFTKFAPGAQTSLGTVSVNNFRGKVGLAAISDATSKPADPSSSDASAAGDATADSGSSGVVADAKAAVKDVAGDAKGAVKAVTGSVGADVADVAKAASGSVGSDVADVAEDLGKGFLHF